MLVRSGVVLGLCLLFSSMLPWSGSVSSMLRSTSTVPGATPARSAGVTRRSGQRFSATMSFVTS
ncbi:hypothetical protein ACVW0J_007949 [Bradyrhizobium sp. i1.7.7]